jgi:four helix bundle protein
MEQERIENNPIVKLTFGFSLAVIACCMVLGAQKEFHLSKQLFRSGNSIGANGYEAQNAASKADFIHQFKNAAKETDATQYWLLLCKKYNCLPDYSPLQTKLEEINKVISKIIATSETLSD